MSESREQISGSPPFPGEEADKAVITDSQPDPPDGQTAHSEAADHVEPAEKGAVDAEAPESPKEPSEPQKAPGVLDGLFSSLAKTGPLALLIIMGCMAWPIFFQHGQATYCPAELKYLTAFMHAIAGHSWLAPIGLDGEAWTAAQWPALGWIIGLAALIPGITGYLLPAVSFTCTFMAVLGVWCLSLAAGFRLPAAFAASLILLCAPLFAPLPNFMGPATLTAAFTLFSLVFFSIGWRKRNAWLSLPLGFICAALAGLSGGILPFAVPLLASFLFLVWRGSFRRPQKTDAIFGFILLLLIIGIWLGVLMMQEKGNAYLDLLFGNAWQFAWPIPIRWFLPLAAGILGLMPWILMLISVSWIKVLGRTGKSLSASRRENASALIWISLIVALCLAPFIPAFHPSAVIIACLGAVLLGKAFINLSSLGNRFFFLLASLCLIIAGCVLLAVSFESTQSIIFGMLPELPVPDLGPRLLSLQALPVMGGIVLVGGIIGLWFARSWQGAGGLLYAMLLVIILCQPARLMLVPDLAAMPGTPLVPFGVIETKVNEGLKPAPPALPEAQQEESAPATQPEPAQPPALPENPASENSMTAPEAEGSPALPAAEPAPEPAQKPEVTPDAPSGQAYPDEPAQTAPAPPVETPPVAAETPPGSPAPAE